MHTEFDHQHAALSERAFQLPVINLIKHAFLYREALLHNSGAIVVDTRPTTNRAEKRNFKVRDDCTDGGAGRIDWGGYNQALEQTAFNRLHQRMLTALEERKRLYRFTGYIGADPANRIGVTLITDQAHQAHFANLLFFQSDEAPHRSDLPQVTILSSPNVFADDSLQGDRKNGIFIASNYHPDRSTILIGGTKYPGEIKKSMFTFADWLLPQRGILPMHCSATLNADGASSLFFGLSGTGKTTLSALGEGLIGDDETVWSDDGVANLEAGCYAKCVDLDPQREKNIWNAAHRIGALIENVPLINGQLDFSLNAATIRKDGRGGTENTRVAYPMNFIPTALEAKVHPHPKRIVFLTYDATGVLPPVAKLKDENTALYYFLLGYTSKVAGTTAGMESAVEPTFSACFGAPFMPLHPMVYARLLGEKIKNHEVEVYLVNTGLQGGGYGKGGKRISLEDTVSIVRAITSNQLSGTDIGFTSHPLFKGLSIPSNVAGLKNQSILSPNKSWIDNAAYDQAAGKLKAEFEEQMRKMANVPDEIRSAGP